MEQPAFDLCGVLRRIRRRADLSQRELARAIGVSASAVAQGENGTRDLPVGALVAAASLAGLRLALLDAEGREVSGMADSAVRDLGGRRFPAHLDTRYTDIEWFDEYRRDRRRHWYTFTRYRGWRDEARRREGTPDDHQLPQPGDAPSERRARRRREALRRRAEDRRRRFEAGEIPPLREWTCGCPPACDELDDFSGRPVHATDCPCRCDIA